MTPTPTLTAVAPAIAHSPVDPLDRLFGECERRALVAVLRARPELTLERLHDCFAGPYGATLRTITVGELLAAAAPSTLPEDGGPPIDRGALALAERSRGEAFDRLVYEAVAGAQGRFVSARYLRARVGGPRWKLQASLGRLVEAGRILRRGVTSSTRYHVEPHLSAVDSDEQASAS